MDRRRRTRIILSAALISNIINRARPPGVGTRGGLPVPLGREMRRGSVFTRRVLVVPLFGSVAFAALAVVGPTPAWAGVPALNSSPEAPHVIYLDFDGHLEAKSPYTCPELPSVPEGWPIDLHVGDISGQIDAGSVRRIWEAVAEDFAPFFVNVTTDPAKEPLPAYHTDSAVRVAIGTVSTGGAHGLSPATCDSNPAYTNPRIANVVVVRLDPSTTFAERSVARTISHEVGHLYGLAHHSAAPTLTEDWIVAPQKSRYDRYIWRKGTNEFGELQDDVAEIARLLGLRPDEPQDPRQLRATPWSVSGPRRLYTHATLALQPDIDDFKFRVSATGQVAFAVVGGTWEDPLSASPRPGAEPNTRHRFQVRDEGGRVVLACPEGNQLTLTATSQQIAALPTSSCPGQPLSLEVGKTYRVRVMQHPADRLPGNLGRYTVLVDGPVTVDTWPPTATP
jgi:hypothetical protein